MPLRAGKQTMQWESLEKTQKGEDYGQSTQIMMVSKNGGDLQIRPKQVPQRAH